MILDLVAEALRARAREARALGARQRGREEQPRRRRASTSTISSSARSTVDEGPSMWRDPPARAGPRQLDPEADQPRARRARRGVIVGQKVHPYGFRLGSLYGWQSNWFAERRYAEQLHEDIAIRKFIKKKLYHAGISQVVIERTGDKVVLNIHTARPGHPDRQARRRGRDAARGAGRLHREPRDVHQHQGDPQGGARRAARGRERRAPARAPRRVPARDEEGRHVDDEVRRRRASASSARAGSAAPRWAAASGTARGACRCTRCAPRSTTASPRRRPPTA